MNAVAERSLFLHLTCDGVGSTMGLVLWGFRRRPAGQIGDHLHSAARLTVSLPLDLCLALSDAL